VIAGDCFRRRVIGPDEIGNIVRYRCDADSDRIKNLDEKRFSSLAATKHDLWNKALRKIGLSFFGVGKSMLRRDADEKRSQ
jgi:hypothetical protein